MRFTVYAILFVLPFVRPQCTPDQWEGVQESNTAYVNIHNHGILEEYTMVHYDYENKRSCDEVQKFDNGLRSIQRIVTLGEEGVVYVLTYYPVDSCYKYNMTKPFQKNCFPASAKRGADFFLGGDGNFNVSTYYTSTENLKKNYAVSLKGDIGIPVMVTIQGRANYNDIFQTIVYKNISPGIQDDAIFNVPKDCEETYHNDPRLSKYQGFTRDHIIMAH